MQMKSGLVWPQTFGMKIWIKGMLLGLSLLTILLLLMPTRSTQAQSDDLMVTWSSAETDNTMSLDWGDWDGDGDLDLAVGNKDEANRVYRNEGDNLLLVWSSPEADDTFSIGWGDLNGDGFLDLAVGNGNQPSRVYTATVSPGGELTFSEATILPDSTGEWTESVAWGDWDGDGDDDLAIGSSLSAPNRVYTNTGSSLELAWTSAETEGTKSVAWGDWDNDGDLDLAVGNYWHQPNRVYVNTVDNNGQRILEPDWSSAEGDQTWSVAWGDWNEDGFLDLAVGNHADPDPPAESGQANRVYLNVEVGDGSRDLALAWTSPEKDDTYSVAWGDWDGDGDDDLAVGNLEWPTLQPANRIYANNVGANDERSLDLIWSSSETDDTRSVAWGDWDNDGDLDLAVGNQHQPNRIYTNGGGQLDLIWSSFEVENTRSVAWGDWDNDGDLDLAKGGGSVPTRVYVNNEGELTLGWSSDETDDTYSVAWGDRDGDGDLDLAVGNYGHNRVYINKEGTLTLAWSSNETNNTTSVAWADWDNDGDLDLAVGNHNQPNQVYENIIEGGNYSLEPVWESQESDWTISLAWGDWDNDGHPDLAVGNNGQPNRVYANEGDHLTPAAVWSANLIENTFSIAWGDWNNDDYLDLAVGNAGPGQNRVYTNVAANNQGRTLDLTWSSAEVEATWSVAWGDWNGDGDLDLAVGNGSWPSRVYANGVTPEGRRLTMVWSTNEADDTRSVAWGDWDRDGDLDLVWGNGGQADYVYANRAERLALAWSSPETSKTTSVAWADWDGDGDLDLAVGNGSGQRNRVYINEDHHLTLAWKANEVNLTQSVAWGDWDGDGDLDLAVGNGQGQPNRVYANEGGTLTPGAIWSSNEGEGTRSVAWGDWDGDGDLDLAVGNNGPVNRVYANEGNNYLTPVWASSERDGTISVAWGDWDGDGDLDLAVGNYGQPNRIYVNKGNTLSLVWSAPEVRNTTSVAWGDWDGDGDLDLAVGNQHQFNQVYANNSGTMTLVWSSPETDVTNGVAWGDWDGDGDLDLVVGNRNQPNRVYTNRVNALGQRSLFLAWSSPEKESSTGVAWGDWDNDGDLDLAVGNNNRPERVYQNRQRDKGTPLNHMPYVAMPRPGITDDAHFFSSPDIMSMDATGRISIPYTLFDPDGETVNLVSPEFSLNGGGQWLPATAAADENDLEELTASPEGVPYTYRWHAEADVIKNDNTLFRLRVQPTQPAASPIEWPSLAGQSPTFRVAAPWFIKVVDEDGDPISQAAIYANGQPITHTVTGQSVTDQAGLLNAGPLAPDTELVALVQKSEQSTVRDAHDGWAYRTYLTNIKVDAQGNTQPFTVTQPGPQLLTVRPKNSLTLFNLVISIEWDATAAYLQDVELAMERAADFLYNATDGQMTFGPVAIYDNAQHWANADIQISTKNIVRPHAFIGGITDEDKAHVIRVGRFWDGNSGNQGAWSEDNGFKTLVHEFGHYGLGLYDEYFGYDIINDQLAGQREAFCTGPENRTGDSDGSLMDYHYTTSELVDASRWSEWCQQTAQHQLNNGEADWETLLRLYRDPSGQERWQLVSPDQRAEEGQTVPGPLAVPLVLPFPMVTIHNAGPSPDPVSLTVCHNGSPYREGTWVTLYSGNQAIDQGITGQTGQLDILGLQPGNTLQVVSLDGTLTASALAPFGGAVDLDSTESDLTVASISTTVSTADILALGASGLSSQGNGAGPYLRLWPTTNNNTLDGLRLVVTRTLSNDNLVYTLVGPDDLGPSGALPYDSGDGEHQIQISFVPAALTGHARVLGFHNNKFIDINADYRLQHTTNLSDTNLFSNDGNLRLHLDPGSLELNEVHFLIASPWGLPGPPPTGLEIVGEAYEVTASNNVTGTVKPMVLSLRYDPEAGAGAFENLAIHRWNFITNTWQSLGGELDLEQQTVATTTTTLGLYALMGSPLAQSAAQADLSGAATVCQTSSEVKVYLPLVMKN